MDKVIAVNDHCLFCGCSMQKKYDEYTPFYECCCAAAVENRRIDAEIEKLNDSKPKHKYCVESKLHLVSMI